MVRITEIKLWCCICKTTSLSIVISPALKTLQFLPSTPSDMVKVGTYGLEHSVISPADPWTQLFSVPVEALAR